MSIPLPRKRRTREHVIADLSVNHVERFVLEAGHTPQRLTSDYGYDLLLATFDDQGYAEPGHLYVQLKASERLEVTGSGYAYDLDVRDYNLWMAERMPVLLVLYEATRRNAYWVCVQSYFRRSGRVPIPSGKTVRVIVPRRQMISRRGLGALAAFKREWIQEAEEG